MPIPQFPDPGRFTTYHITLTCYGTWLLGSPKGSTRHGGVYIPPNDALEHYMRGRCKYPAVSFTEEMRRTVFNAIVAECEFNRWTLHALNTLAQHVHALITVPVGDSGRYAVSRFKSASLRALQTFGQVGDSPVWTKGGNSSEVKTVGYFRRVYNYILNSQPNGPIADLNGEANKEPAP